MTPHFSDQAARRRWDSYFDNVDRVLSRGLAEAAELRSDLATHVIDSMAAAPSGSELDRLNVALSRLGEPIDYLRPLLADEFIERGTRTYSPVTIARGLSLALLAGSRRTVISLVFGIGYLLLAVFVIIALLKPLWGENVGLFRHTDGTIDAGIVADTAGAQELLGLWSIPIALVLATILYVVLTKGLRVLRQRP
jgi:hypothetical protein